ncbi:MAG: putative manganese-dependent inorganic diphosphatase [Oscillospiraceae bacterium]|nr:putative manganese-dependent inorganic diphosphatase [Oscillospiraceae bacterium]
MDTIYVTGHRNPDTDSIVAAIAYTALRNACGDREYEAACLGDPSDETKSVLDRFGFQPPKRIYNVFNQIRDLDFAKPPVLSTAVTVGRAWDIMQEKSIGTLPVAKEDGTLYGILSRDHVASYHMSLITESYLQEVPLFNVLSVLEGTILNEAGETTDTISGNVVIALPQSQDTLLWQDPDSIVICGHQPYMIRRALEMNVKCLVLCETELTDDLRNLPTKTCIITTPFDAYRASRLIFQSTPIGRICRTENITTFHMDDRVEYAKEESLKHRESGYPILDENDQIVGMMNRYHLLRPRHKRVVLVDHNETSQSVPGLEEARIVAIIDHHRIADIETTNPIYLRNEPVGSTNTIIADMFRERGLIPTPALAGLMASAIVSDTVMFKSPTCTDRDIKAAQRMARIANISLESLGKLIFSTSISKKSSEEMLTRDYKEFHIAGHPVAVSQVTCMDSPVILERKEELLNLMKEHQQKKKLTMMIFMITDVLLEGTHIIYVGNDETIQHAFSVMPRDNTAFLPHVMSRKKQIIPMLTAIWG